MRVISFRDLLLCEELQHIKNEVCLLHPDNDETVRNVLTQIGFHPAHPVEYIPSMHRDLRDVAKIGFQAVGEFNRDRKYNKFLDAYSLTVVSGMSDVSLAKEMVSLMGRSVKYQKPAGTIKEPSAKKQAKYEQDALDEYDEEFPDEYSDGEYVEEEYEDNLKAIVQLEEIRDQIRGVK